MDCDEIDQKKKKIGPLDKDSSNAEENLYAVTISS